MGTFRTKLDFSNNRQVKQRIETTTVLSGGTSFGVTYSQLPSGPNYTLSAITHTIPPSSATTGTFSGNNTTTVFTWPINDLYLADNTFSAITPSNSASSQTSNFVFTADTSTMFTVDGNVGYGSYTGVGFTMFATSFVGLGGGSYSGTVNFTNVNYVEAPGLDYSGRTIWNDTSGITRTERLIITNNPQVGYVWTCIDSEGMGEWQYNGSSSGQTLAQVLVNGNSTGANDISVDYGRKIFSNYTYAASNYEHKIGFGNNPGNLQIVTINNTNGKESRIELTGNGNGEIQVDNALNINAPSFIVSDTSGGGSFAGIEYNLDYSANYTNRSLVDKEYVDFAISGSTIWTAGTGSNSAVLGGSGGIASGYTSVSEGTNTIASGDYSHAEGVNTIASGIASHAEGLGDSNGYPTASGDGSHAEGYATTASGDYSHAQGNKTVASGTSSHAGGEYSEIHSNYGFIHSYFSNIYLNSESSAILGGYLNTIDKSEKSGIFVGSNNTISGGTSGNTYNMILGGKNNEVYNHSYSTIINGSGNTIHFDILDFNNPNNFEMIENSVDSVISASTLSKISSSNSMTIANSIVSTVINSVASSFDPDPYITSGGIIGGTDDENGLNATADYSTIINGSTNTINSTRNAIIIGGSNVSISGNSDQSVAILSKDSYIDGTSVNSGLYSTELSLITNSSNLSTITGGYINRILSSNYSSVLGGIQNVISGSSSLYNSIIGGLNNGVFGTTLGTSIISSYEAKIYPSQYSVILGGYQNIISGLTYSTEYNTILGGSSNVISGNSLANSSILGGVKNIINTTRSTIVGGSGNTITKNTDELTTPINSGIFAGANNKIIPRFGSGSNFVSGSYCVIAGGESNTISGHSHSFIGGGFNNLIECNAAYNAIVAGQNNINHAFNGVIIGGQNNTLGFSTSCPSVAENSIILGGSFHKIGESSNDTRNTAIIGGTSNLIDNTVGDVNNTVILGGSNITATTSNTVYMNNLYVTQTGGGVLETDLDGGAGSLVSLSGSSKLPRFAMSVGTGGVGTGAGGSIGVRAWDDVTYTPYGQPGDMHIYAGISSNGLNIISADGSGGAEDYIRFYAGRSANMGGDADIHIQGTGATQGFVGLGTENPLAKLHVSGDTRISDVLTVLCI
jgi:hypothetical protein